MTTWIETTNVKQDGTPATRRIKIPNMSEDIWFTDNAYAEVADDVADILANNISTISKLSSAPSSPGSYYGDAGDNTTVEIVVSDGAFNNLTVESLDSDAVSTGKESYSSGGALAIYWDENTNNRVVDSYDTVQGAFDAIPMAGDKQRPAGYVELVPRGQGSTITWNEYVEISERLKLAGNGISTRIVGEGANPTISAVTGDDIVLEDLWVDSLGDDNAIAINSEELHVRNVNVDHAGRSAISLGGTRHEIGYCEIKGGGKQSSTYAIDAGGSTGENTFHDFHINDELDQGMTHGLRAVAGDTLSNIRVWLRNGTIAVKLTASDDSKFQDYTVSGLFIQNVPGSTAGNIATGLECTNVNDIIGGGLHITDCNTAVNATDATSVHLQGFFGGNVNLTGVVDGSITGEVTGSVNVDGASGIHLYGTVGSLSNVSTASGVYVNGDRVDPVDASTVTPDYDGQRIRDDGTNFSAGEYAWADTTNGNWVAMSDPTLTVAY